MGTTATPNLGLIKPDGNELASNFDTQNAANMDILDALDPRIDTLETYLTKQSIAFKNADQIVNNSTTFVDDTALVFAGLVAGSYILDCFLAFDGNIASDFKAQLSFSGTIDTSALQFTAVRDQSLSPGHITSGTTLNSTVVIPTNGAGSIMSLLYKGGIKLGGTGTLKVIWAQNTAHASNTIVRVGSYLKLERV